MTCEDNALIGKHYAHPSCTCAWPRRMIGAPLVGEAKALNQPSCYGQAHGSKGQRVWSESLMVLYFDPSLQTGVSLRVSRYPEAGLSWVWCQVIIDGTLYSYVDHRLPSRKFHNDPTSSWATIAYQKPDRICAPWRGCRSAVYFPLMSN